MQEARAPPKPFSETRFYTCQVPRKPSSSRGKRPEQGDRLLAFRRAAGLTQIQLAERLGVAHANIAFWEWSDKPPRSDLLQQMAEILGVTVGQLLGQAAPRRRPGPVSKLERMLDEVRGLPRSKQELVIQLAATLVEQHRKAS